MAGQLLTATDFDTLQALCEVMEHIKTVCLMVEQRNKITMQMPWVHVLSLLQKLRRI